MKRFSAWALWGFVPATGANLRSGSPSGALIVQRADLVQDAEATAMSLLKEQGGMSLSDAIRHVHKTMRIEDAEQRLHGQLPEQVSTLLSARKEQSADRQAAPKLSEDSLKKARVILNGMVSKSFAELDDVIIDCKAYERMNRKSFDQVKVDLARLGSEIAGTGKGIAENLDCIKDQDAQFAKTKESKRTQQLSYEKTKAMNQQEMTVKKNDLAVFDFIMDITKCGKKGAFLQLGNTTEPVQVCETEDGLILDFSDPSVQARYEQIITPEAQDAVSKVLSLALLEKPKRKKPSQQQSRTMQAPKLAPKPIPVVEKPNAAGQWKKCSPNKKPNCGLLHDTMSLEWGKFKDLVDELQADMDKADDEWEALSANLNTQLDMFAGQKGSCQTKMSETVASKNLLTEEKNEKDAQHHELEASYQKKMAICKARVEELLYTGVCATIQVRNEVMKSSKVSPPEKITDCDVKDWVPGQCSVACDNACPKKVGGVIDPFACGGTQTLTRSIVVKNNDFGVTCPSLKQRTRCGQFKCPVDCKMSKWSRWSACTKECETGTAQKTRSVLAKPKNGGQSCDSTVETRSCNVGSCDRDCKLQSWTAWGPCSMSCNPGNTPGFQERTRSVLVPIRGNGKCPNAKHVSRYQKRVCNEHRCRGDEVCVAKQDLIIALDASGSLRESGFKILRNFVVNLTSTYKAEYAGAEAVRLGVVLFGNGARQKDGTVSPAINVVGLTKNFAEVRKKVKATKWQKGFTNLAQAFTLADTMLSQKGRKDAQSAVLVLSDGKYSFAFETEQAVKKLKSKGVMVFMAPVAQVAGSWQTKLKQWASQPWETNYKLIPGMQALRFNMNMFRSALVAKFCPNSMSPTGKAKSDDARRFMLAFQGGLPNQRCGGRKYRGKVKTAQECYDKVSKLKGFQAFAITTGSRGACFSLPSKLDWNRYAAGKRDEKPCPNGKWKKNPFFKTYVMKPVVI